MGLGHRVSPAAASFLRLEQAGAPLHLASATGLVDAISTADVTTALVDPEPDVAPLPAPDGAWVARPLPTPAQPLSDALLQRATRSRELARADVLATALRVAIDARAAGASIPRRAGRGRRTAAPRPSAACPA